MAKKRIEYFVFEPGISKDDNLYPNAVALLLANKTFLQQEVVRFINYNITNGVSPYIDYTYASSKCTRDVGYFIDAVLHDLRYGGNVQTRQTSEYFWINGEPQIRGDVSPEITGQAYLRDVINNYIFTNTTVPTTYGSPSSPQVKYIGSNAEAGADDRNTELWAIFADVIENGTPAIPAKEVGVSSIRVQGRYTQGEILLITSTETGEILYNFSDPQTSLTINYKNAKSSGNNEPLSDLDFKTWWQTGDCITTFYLSRDTSTLSATDDIQIFVEEPYQTIRPWEFGTDAIERMRVASPQAMLDADFEYGLQPTKWQAIGLLRNYPSLYEVPGTDLTITEITTDASVDTGNFGASLITVTTSGSHGFEKGTPITVKGLNGTISGFSRAEGSFLVNSVVSSLTFTYYSSAKVGTTEGESLYTSVAQIRQAGFYTGSAIGNATFSLFSNGSDETVISKFDTPSGSFQIAFDGTSPSPGSPISGSPLFPVGTSVSGVVGATTVNAFLKETASPTDTTIQITDLAGVQPGMAIDNGAGEAVFINSISGNIVYLSAEFGQSGNGANADYEDVSGTNILGIGTGATFTVSRSASIYTVVDAGDSSSNGQDYAVGDRVTIAGDDLGGVSPDNDITVEVVTVTSSGAIETFTFLGTAITGGASYTAVAQNTSSGTGIAAVIDVDRQGGTGTYTITLADGGSGHIPGDELTFFGANFGGSTPENNIVIRVDGVAFGTQAVVDYTVLSGIGATGDAEYTSIAGTNVPVIGTGAQFVVTSLDGVYSAVPSGVPGSSTGTDYQIGNRIVIAGDDLGGVSPLNDCTLTVTGLSGSAITSVSADGTTFTGDEVAIYPALTLSESLTGSLANGTTLNVGAIATIQVDFPSNHGLLPGSSILASITSEPTPEFLSTTISMPSSQTWSSVAFYGSTFVAVANATAVTAKSLDGTTWSAGGSLPSSTTWNSVAAGEIDGTVYYVAVAAGGTAAAYSTDDGGSWTAATLPSSGTWTAVTFFNGSFVAVRSGSTAAAYSIDGGATWTAATLPSSSNWSAVAGGVIGSSDYFVAVATGGTAGAYSVDGGANWAAATLPASANWSGVAYGNSRFVAVASGSTSAAVSTNGTVWTSSTLPSSTTWKGITFGEDVFVVHNQADAAAISFTGFTGAWTAETLDTSATWNSIAFGDYSGLGIFNIVGAGANSLNLLLTSANHTLADGPFVVTAVPTPSTLRYPARTTGSLNTSVVPLAGTIYTRPDSFFIHRPFDGGVQLGTGGPQHGAQAIRQSKKYIRYQSGKGIMYTTGALFAPNYNLSSATAVDYPAGSFITFTTDDTDHGVQPGGVVEISGFSSFEYNGIYTVESVVSSRSFRVRALVPLSTLDAVLGADAKMAIKNWHGSTVRVGAFDDQNGIFWQYDGEEMAFVRRSSTFQMTGQIAIAAEANQVTGTGTRFTQQLKVHDKVVIRGMTHTVTSISSDTALTVAPDWRGVRGVVGAKMCLIEELVIPQSQWNIDKADGTGASGYNLIPQRMQMIGIQYSWYAAGFIEFMARGSDGKFVFLHRIRNSNINFEAYMRTANLPVRYEVENRSALGKLKASIDEDDNSMELVDASKFPTTGTIYIDNELISYSGKVGNSLTGLSRAANLSNFASGQNRTYTAGSASAHTAGTGLALVSCTITPTINHWGSAILTDGLFDEDRGYIFNYAATGLSTSVEKQTAFMIRLAPSVSNAIVGDLGERDLLNRAQLLLDEVACTADSGTGALVIEGILNPRNYPDDPTKITWSGLSSSGAGGQPSFAQIALGGSINWGGASLTTTAATVQGTLTTSLIARAFNTVTFAITAKSFNSGQPFGNNLYRSAFSTSRVDFLITDTQYDSLASATPLRVGDTLTSVYLTGGRTITAIVRDVAGSGYTQITMNTTASFNSPQGSGNDISVTVTSSISTGYANAISAGRADFLVTDADYTTTGIQTGDVLSLATFVTGGQTITSITNNYAVVAGVSYTRVTMSANGNSTSPAASNRTLTVTAAGTSSSYSSTNYLFFTNASWNSSGASTGTKIATSVTSFPANTSVTAVTSRTLGGVTVRRVTFTQNSNTSIAAAASIAFQFGDVQYALPGEQVFSFLVQPGSTNSLNLEKLKELTTTAIGGRGAFPNGPDVLAINVYKVSGTAVPASIILRWGEAQA